MSFKRHIVCEQHGKKGKYVTIQATTERPSRECIPDSCQCGNSSTYLIKIKFAKQLFVCMNVTRVKYESSSRPLCTQQPPRTCYATRVSNSAQLQAYESRYRLFLAACLPAGHITTQYCQYIVPSYLHDKIIRYKP